MSSLVKSGPRSALMALLLSRSWPEVAIAELKITPIV